MGNEKLIFSLHNQMDCMIDKPHAINQSYFSKRKATMSMYNNLKRNPFPTRNHFANESWRKQNVGNNKQLSKCGKLHQNHIVLNNNIVTKLICINKLKLPDVLIDIIKDYLYYSSEVIFNKMLTQRVVENMSTLQINSRYMIGQNDNIVYEWELRYNINGALVDYQDSQPTPTFKYYFCTQCGNYSNDYLYEDEDYSYHVLCHCENHPYYQYHENAQEFKSVCVCEI